MSASATRGPEEKRALYWLGDRLIDHRHWISLLVIAVTALFAYWAFQLKLETSFGDLLPQNHPFVRVHNKYASTFGGANNIQLMLEARHGDIFTVPTLARIFRMTQEMDKVYGVNHNQIDSIGHRTTRYLRVAAGGTLRAEPVMITIPKTAEDAAAIKRIVHDTESIYGILVSLDDKAALIRANFIEARLDHRRTFREVNERVITPFTRGWIGALIRGQNPLRLEEPAPAVVQTVYRGTPAAAAGLVRGDTIVGVDRRPVRDWIELAKMIAGHRPGDRVHLAVVRGRIERLLRRAKEFSVGGHEVRTWPELARELAARASSPGKIEVRVVREGGGKEAPKPELVSLTAVPTDLTVAAPDIDVYVAGEPRLYGWIYRYAGDVFWILVVTYCIEWLLRWFYFHDWRGSLRPTLTGVVAAFWGLGFVHLIGLALDPLILVMPFLITARAVSHAIQMHERYYEEYHRQNWDKRRAIVAAFAELFVPTLSGITTDALGVLAILLVPVVMLQKLAIVASFWIAAITVAELLLNPIVYYYLRAPDEDVVLAREHGWFRRAVEWTSDRTLGPRGRRVTLVAWAVAAVAAASFMPRLIVGDPTAASPLVWRDSPYNVSHRHIQEKFGGVEPLIVVAEGHNKNAMKDPATLHTMERFQRYLERDPDVGYSFSLVDILRAVNMVFHEMEPKWGVIPNNWVDVGSLFFVFFSGSPPTETAKYVDASYTTAHVTFFCKNHKGDTIRRIIHRCNTFIGKTAREQLGFAAEAAKDAVVRVRRVVPGGLAAKYGLQKGDVILDAEPLPLPPKGFLARLHEAASRRLFGWPVRTIDDLDVRLRDAVASPSGLRLEVRRNGKVEPVVISEAPSKAAFKLAGGLIGVLAAANQALVGNDVLMNILGFGTIYVIVLFTYRSWAAGLYLLAPLLLANLVINAYMAARGIGINVNTLPLVTVGVGFGIDYGLYIVSRVIEEIRVSGDLEDAVRRALVTSGKAVTFTAIAMVTSTFVWVFSNIRFDAEMGGLLALWMAISFLGAETLLPVLVVVMRPRFILRQAARGHVGAESPAAAAS